MYLIRTLLSYSLVIIIAAAGVFAYQHRGELVPDVKAMYEGYRTKFMAAVEKLPTTYGTAKQQEDESTVSKGRERIASEQIATEQIASEQIAPEQEQPVAGNVDDSKRYAEVAVKDESPGEKLALAGNLDKMSKEGSLEATKIETVVAAVAADPVEGNAIENNEKKSTPPDTVMSHDAPAEAAIKEPVNDRASGKPTVEDDLLAMARNAYWRNQYDESVSAYQKLVDTNPADPNAYGELGNVYYAMGSWEKAGTAYYEAALLLLKSGQTGQVDYLLRVLEGVNAEKAKELVQQLHGKS